MISPYFCCCSLGSRSGRFGPSVRRHYTKRWVKSAADLARELIGPGTEFHLLAVMRSFEHSCVAERDIELHGGHLTGVTASGAGGGIEQIGGQNSRSAGRR